MRKILLALLLLPSVALAEWPAIRNDGASNIVVPSNGLPGPLSMTSTGILYCQDPILSSTIGKFEDAAHATGHAGAFVLSVRDDDLSSDSNDGDYQSFRSDSVGRLYVNPYGGDVGRFLSACSSAAITTADTAIVGAVGGNRIYVTSLSCNNNSAVASLITLKDGATARWSYYVGPSTVASSVFHVTFPTPIRGTANTALNFAMTTTATSTICCATYFTSGL